MNHNCNCKDLFRCPAVLDLLCTYRLKLQLPDHDTVLLCATCNTEHTSECLQWHFLCQLRKKVNVADVRAPTVKLHVQAKAQHRVLT